VVFLGIGGLGSQTPDYPQSYWRETVERAGARRVIPIHWDGLMSPIEGPFRGPLRVVALVAGSGAGTLEFMKEKEAASPGLTIETLPRYAPVELF
jgi:L-ascorbate metabolism protein UlaG (beta-lactamase superfamily)